MEAVMKNALRLAGMVVCILFATVSCSQLYTESVGSSLARDGVDIPSSTSIDDLLDIARTRDAADPDVAKEILEILGDKDPEDIANLTIEEQTDILDLAGAAVIDLETITNLSQDIDDNPDNQNELIQNAIDDAGSDVDTTVLEQLLSDNTVLTEAPAESVVIAAVAIIASVSAETDAETVTDILANPDSLASSSLTQEQQDQLSIVINATNVLETRSDIDDITIGDFDLLDILRGNQ